MSIIRRLIEDEGVRAGYLQRRGVIPGDRHNANDPATYQSDLVEDEVQRIMADAEALADVLQTATEMLLPRPVAELLAYLTFYRRKDYAAVPDPEVAGASQKAVEGMVREHVRKEAGLD